MRHTYVKLAALLLVLVFALTGCNLIKVDQVEIIRQERAEIEELYSAVVANYDGGDVTVFEALGPFYSNYSYMSQMYAYFGMEISDEDITSMQQEAVQTKVLDYVIEKEFENRGLSIGMTEEELRAQVDEEFAASRESYLEYSSGKTEEERIAEAELALYVEGFTPEALYESYMAQYRSEALQADVESEITEVTEEQLQAAYDERVAANQETYTAAPASYESDVTDETVGTICWVPEGYRTVKHVLVIPEEAVLQAVTDARNALKSAQDALAALETEMESAGDDEDSRTAEEIQADIDAKNAEIAAQQTAVADAEAACLASVKAKTDLIYADLAAGKGIDEVMAAYGEDPGMQSEPNMSTGYYVREDSTLWDANFTAGSMALAQVGDYSAEPVISASGVHIIYYNSDVTGGAVPMENVREALAEETLATLKTEHYTACMSEWYEAINAEYHMENWVW